MTLPTQDCLTAISAHSAGLAAAARGNLGAPVRHCPGWTVADLVAHVSDVHWFWATIVAERPQEMPDYTGRRPARAPEDELVDRLEAGAAHLVQVLGDADQDAPCWTWAPGHERVGFVTRHQVQEAAVHHWDAADAAGRPLFLEDDVASDAVEEFLTVSVSSDADPAEPERPSLDGRLWLRRGAADTPGTGWLVEPGRLPGTVTWRHLAAGEQPLAGASVGAVVTPGEALLWLYGRADLDERWHGDLDVLARFRALCFTD